MNWHICHKKNYFFVCIFNIYPFVFTQFSSGRTWYHHVFSGIYYFFGRGVCQTYALWVFVECGIKFHIQWVPTWHTFDGPCYPKDKKYLKKNTSCHHHIFQVFLVFGEVGSIKSMQCGYSLDADLNYASNELSLLKFE